MTVVFMPYLASMWDCMSTIYEYYKQIAKVYVVPIPYYGKDAYGYFTKLYYDGRNFPKGVRITHYDKIDLKQLHPDKIFIHNAYDSHNLIISVEPKFYSYKLKACTNHLVYVPYFTASVVPEQFLNLPGAQNADEIIVETEQQKLAYARVLGEDKQITIRESSKIESILSEKLEDKVIPKRWQKKIQDKKVVFFNTGVHQFVCNPNYYFYGTRKDLENLKKKQDTVVLWRPHPLLTQAIIAVDKRLLIEYEELIKWFKTWGIFDTSSDLHRAVLLADEFCGDGSSITRLFEALNKKVSCR